MNDVSYQIDANIKQVYQNHPKAHQLAIDCITASKCFVIDFISFISQEYSTWQTRGFNKEARCIICQIVWCVFEDLESAHVSVCHMQDKGNMDYTAAGIIFAMLNCHNIMTQYIQHHFHQHPVVSSVITWHLVANFVNPEQGQDQKLMKMEGKVAIKTSCLASKELGLLWEVVSHEAVYQPKLDHQDHSGSDDVDNHLDFFCPTHTVMLNNSSCKTGWILSESWPSWLYAIPKLDLIIKKTFH
jgi:tellurite resistance-related uncharacterized protein